MARPAALSPGWTVALGAALGLAVLAALPSALGGEAGAAVRGGFALVCHQIPERSPHLAGGPAALCHRCWGVLLGLVAGLLLAPGAGPAALRRLSQSPRQGLALALALGPAAVDWSLGALGLWANTPASRTLTGAAFGAAAGAILAANLLAGGRRVPSPLPST